MIVLMIGDFQPFTLFKVVKQWELIQEEIYCIKEPCKKTDWSSDEYYKKKFNLWNTHFTYYALFKYYDDGMNSRFYGSNSCGRACFEHADSTQIIFNTNIPIVVYRNVTKEEYYAKLKEKYNRKVLNIILKNLVDENFQSNYL